MVLRAFCRFFTISAANALLPAGGLGRGDGIGLTAGLDAALVPAAFAFADRSGLTVLPMESAAAARDIVFTAEAGLGWVRVEVVALIVDKGECPSLSELSEERLGLLSGPGLGFRIVLIVEERTGLMEKDRFVGVENMLPALRCEDGSFSPAFSARDVPLPDKEEKKENGFSTVSGSIDFLGDSFAPPTSSPF